jgi:hypothetical protein
VRTGKKCDLVQRLLTFIQQHFEEYGWVPSIQQDEEEPPPLPVFATVKPEVFKPEAKSATGSQQASKCTCFGAMCVCGAADDEVTPTARTVPSLASSSSSGGGSGGGGSSANLRKMAARFSPAAKQRTRPKRTNSGSSTGSNGSVGKHSDDDYDDDGECPTDPDLLSKYGSGGKGGGAVDHSKKKSKRRPMTQLHSSTSNAAAGGGSKGQGALGKTPAFKKTSNYRTHATPQADGTLLRSSSEMERQVRRCRQPCVRAVPHASGSCARSALPLLRRRRDDVRGPAMMSMTSSSVVVVVVVVVLCVCCCRQRELSRAQHEKYVADKRRLRREEKKRRAGVAEHTSAWVAAQVGVRCASTGNPSWLVSDCDARTGPPRSARKRGCRRLGSTGVIPRTSTTTPTGAGRVHVFCALGLPAAPATPTPVHTCCQRQPTCVTTDVCCLPALASSCSSESDYEPSAEEISDSEY